MDGARSGALSDASGIVMAFVHNAVLFAVTCSPSTSEMIQPI